MSERIIVAEQNYTAPEAAHLLGLRAKVRLVRALDRLGVPSYRLGKNRLYKGADLLAFLKPLRKVS